MLWTLILLACGSPATAPTEAPLPAWAGTEAELVAAEALRTHDVAVGEGPTAAAGDRVTVHYTGWLADGTKFDSSHDRGSPFSATLGRGQVIKGWDEGVRGMAVGGKRGMVIPSELGYGVRGMPPLIPPRSVLVFEIELVALQQGT